MGIVLRAWPLVPSVQLRTDTPIALKLLLNTGGQVDQQRFEREARITAGLDPTGVCAIYDAGMLDDGTPFIAMELLDGEDLDDRLAREGALPPVEAVDLLLAAIDVLAEAHLAGLVHRDLKPSNLFLALTPLGPQLKVLDFGIVKILQGSAQTSVLTQTGEILGSPAYMAPEQLMDSGRIDHRIDIWALGVILYELLSGRPPFDGRSLIDLCQAVFTAEPQPLPQFGALDGIISRCLAKNADDRFRDLAELAEALAPHASAAGRAWSARTLHRFGVDVPRAPAGAPYPFQSAATVESAATAESAHALSFPRRRRSWPAKLAGVVLLGGAGLAAGSYFARRGGERTEQIGATPACSGQRCYDDLKLSGEAIEPFERRDAARELALEFDDGPVLTSVMVAGLSPNGAIQDDHHVEVFSFNSRDRLVTVAITRTRTTVHSIERHPRGPSPTGAVPEEHCPLKTVLAIARDASPDQAAQPAMVILIESFEPDDANRWVWSFRDESRLGLTIDAECNLDRDSLY